MYDVPDETHTGLTHDLPLLTGNQTAPILFPETEVQ